MKTMVKALRIVLCGIMLGALATSAWAGQDVPQGVNYKKATAETNARAKAVLERALAGPAIPDGFLQGPISCGPILWKDLRPTREPLLKDSTPVMMELSVGEVIQAEGRGLRTPETLQMFWKMVLDKYPELRKGIVRPARANEISFYWATIPYDIEEPFFAIETPDNVFVANLRVQKDTILLFSLDRVDDLRKLKK